MWLLVRLGRTVLSDLTLGRQVAFLRRRRGLSQVELADRLGRSESWVSQVERGVRSVDRLSVLERMADELGVAVHELRSGATSEEQVSLPVWAFVDDLRGVLSGPPAGAAVFGAGREEFASDIRSLVAEVDAVWQMTHASQSEEVCRRLSELLPMLEQGARRASGKGRARWYEALAWAYQAASAVLSVLGDADACWVAADRAMMAGERAGSSLLVVSGAHRLVLSFLRTGRVVQARLVADRTLEMLATSLSPGRRRCCLYGARCTLRWQWGRHETTIDSRLGSISAELMRRRRKWARVAMTSIRSSDRPALVCTALRWRSSSVTQARRWMQPRALTSLSSRPKDKRVSSSMSPARTSSAGAPWRQCVLFVTPSDWLRSSCRSIG